MLCVLQKFDEFPQYSLLKELFTQVSICNVWHSESICIILNIFCYISQIFGVPYHHPKSQPFIDHVYTFTILDRRIWFRNYQIVEEDGSLAEIGNAAILKGSSQNCVNACILGASCGTTSVRSSVAVNRFINYSLCYPNQ